MDWGPRSPDPRTSRNQLGTWTHSHLGEGHWTTAWVPLISRVWELPRSPGPEDQGAPGSQVFSCSQPECS